MSRLTLALIILFSSIGIGLIFILFAPNSWGLWAKIPTAVLISTGVFWLPSVIDDNIRYQKRKQIQLRKKLEIRNIFRQGRYKAK